MEPQSQAAAGLQRRRNLAWTFGLGTLLTCSLIVILGVTVADPDLWGHIRFGLDILRDGALHETDPYSYATEGQVWINHEWLAEVLFALAWSEGGAAGMVALKILIGLATTGLLFGYLASLRIPPVQALIFFFLLCMPLMVPYFGQVRPQVFTWLLFAALLVVLRRAENRGYHWIWMAAPLIGLWANLHGGVLAGLGIFAIWTVLQLIDDWAARWRIVAPALAGAAAALMTPYGTDLLIFLLTTGTGSRPEINDWQPLPLVSPFGLFYLVIVLTVASGLAFTRKSRRPSELFLVALMALLPWLAVRHLPLFSIAALVLTGGHVADAWNRLVTTKGTPMPIPPSWAISFPFFAGLGLLAVAAREGTFTQIRVRDIYPVAAVDLLSQSGVAGKLAIEFGWGEYALWHLNPQIRVGMDGRRETVYPQHVYDESLNFRRGNHDWDAALRRHAPDMALVRSHEAAQNLLRLSPGWQPVFEDKLSVLFVRRDAPQLEALQRAAATFVPPPPKQSFP